jgi:hypothetical protein
LHFDALGGLAVLSTTLLALSGTIGAGQHPFEVIGTLTNVAIGLAGVTITSAMGFTSAVSCFYLLEGQFLTWHCRFTGRAGDLGLFIDARHNPTVNNLADFGHSSNLT